MSKFRFYTSLLVAFFRRFSLLLVFGVMVGVLGFLGVRFFVNKFYPKDIIYIGMVGKYRTDNLPVSFLSQLSEGLTKLDEHGVPGPSLAKSWKSLDSGKTWEFTLDTNRVWIDGTKVTSDTISYSFEDVTLTRPDDHTLVFHLSSPYAPFPVVVARPVFKKGLMGTGPFVVLQISQSGSYVQILELVKGIAHKVYKFYPNEEAVTTAFKLGQIDRLEDTGSVSAFDNWQTVAIGKHYQPTRYVAIFFNNIDPLFKDNKTLRQALAYGAPKDSWGGERAIGPIPPQSWAYNSQVKPYDYDLPHAQQLIQTAIKKGEKLKIKLSAVPELLGVGSDIARAWEKLGIATTVEITNDVSADFQVLLAEYDASLDPDQYLTWHSTQTETNVSHYANPRIDKLLEDGRQELDLEKRKKIYLDFQRFLLEDEPAIFLYHPVTYTVVRK